MIMNYYIQGDAANADKIKAAFEMLGIDALDFGFADKTLVYCSIGGCVQSLPYSINLMHILYSHPDYKELELPVEPKFKVGDEVVWTEPKGDKPAEPVKIIQLIDKDQLYMVDMANGIGYIHYDMQDYYKLAPKPHYDIANFHAGMPVLVRDFYKHNEWTYAIFSHYNENHHETCRFMASDTGYWQCIPFNDDTKHLLGTSDMCDKQFINW